MTLPGRSLDDYRICEVPGCQWHVLEPSTRCSEHGGQDGPEYWEDEDGVILVTHHMDLLEGGEQ